jgi:phage gp16-like protein
MAINGSYARMGIRARPAQFDRAAQHRRGMLAKINIAKLQLALDEDDYRQAIFDASGQMSLAACTDQQLDRLLAWCKSKGFRPLPRSNGKSPAAQHPMARKARAMWISLYHLGAVHNPAEQALEAFACRQLHCEKFAWAKQSDAYADRSDEIHGGAQWLAAPQSRHRQAPGPARAAGKPMCRDPRQAD